MESKFTLFNENFTLIQDLVICPFSLPSCHICSSLSTSEQWMSVKFKLWVSTCSLDTVTPIMVAHWQRESWDASSPTITSGKRWTPGAKHLRKLVNQTGGWLINKSVSGLRLRSDACTPPWWLKTTCASRSSSNVAWWTWWVSWRRKDWTGISCELHNLSFYLDSPQAFNCFSPLLSFSFFQLYWSEEDASGSPRESSA